MNFKGSGGALIFTDLTKGCTENRSRMKTIKGKIFFAIISLVFIFSKTESIYAADTWDKIADGIDHLHRTDTSTPLNLHVIKLDLTKSNISIKPILAHDEWGGTRETTSSMAKRKNAIVAINGDYFDSGGAQGTTIIDGTVYDFEDYKRSTLIMSEDHSLVDIGIWCKYCPTTTLPAWVYNAISGGTTILKDGQYSFDPYKENAIDLSLKLSRIPRTGIALSQDKKTLILAVVDGRQPSFSVGMNAEEFANLMIEMGGYTGMDLDGGGSSTMVVNKSIANSPSDGSERLVSNALGVFVTEPCPESLDSLVNQDFTITNTPIYADSSATIDNPNFWSEITFRNDGACPITFDNLYMEIINSATGEHLWNMVDPNTGQALSETNVTIPPSGTHTLNAISYFTSEGIFKVTARGIFKGQLFELGSINFQVHPLPHSGSIIMEGNFVQTAISEDGTLGFGGNTSPGIYHDPTGLKHFGPDDYLTPGSPWELFSVKSDQTGLIGNNNDNGGSYGTISKISLNNLSNIGKYDNYVTWSGQYSDYFLINHEYHFNDNDQKIDIVTKITALKNLTNIKFLRSIDPDPDVYTYGIWDTDNRQGFDKNYDGDFNDSGDILPENWVHAEGKYTGLTIGLYSTASFFHNTGVSSYWSDDPDFFLAGQNDGDWDYTIGLAFDLGNLSAGESRTFNYAYVMGELIEVADIPWVPSKIYETPAPPDSIEFVDTPIDESLLYKITKDMKDFYDFVKDFAISTTGEVIVDTYESIFSKLTLKSGSPAWGSFKLQLTEEINHVEFNYSFTSSARGLLKVFFDDNEIFSADERAFVQGQVYSASIDLPSTPAGTHTLSYRIDPFDGPQSIVEISDIQTGTITKIAYPQGDLNKDGIVDRNDVSMINALLNKPASANPLCDIDKNGKITILDARKLTGMCTFSKCASSAPVSSF